MEAFNSLTLDEKKLTIQNVRGAEAEFLSASQALLKSEWRRVKSGEPTFRIAKAAALFIIIVLLVAGSVAATYKVWWPPDRGPSSSTLPKPPSAPHYQPQVQNSDG